MKVKFTELKIIRDDQCEICEIVFLSPLEVTQTEKLSDSRRLFGTDMCYACSRKKWIWEEDEVEDESWL